METSMAGKAQPGNPDHSPVRSHSEQQHVDVNKGSPENRTPSTMNGSDAIKHSAAKSELESRNHNLDEASSAVGTNNVNTGQIKEAWADYSARENGLDTGASHTNDIQKIGADDSSRENAIATEKNNEANHATGTEKIGALLSGIEVEASKKMEEERIRELLAYMEEEKMRQEAEYRKLKGTQLEDINEADEDTISVSVDSRPSSRQQAQRPTSGRRSIISRPRSSRSRPLSARSGASSEREHVNGFDDPPNSVRSENWFMPSRPPSVIERNQAASITLESGGKYRISLPSDTEKNLISGMTFLDSGDLVVADKGNQKVKFVDKNFVFISQLSVPEPWDVCSVGDEVYVTFGTNVIQHLFVKDMVLNLGKVFEMSDKCFGVANFNNGLAVGLKASEIHLMTLQGEVKRIIKIPKTEKGRSMCPWHLSVTKKFDILVTDPNLRTLCCINSKGELLFRYPDMSNPRATISDTSGNIFLVGLNKDTDLVMQILRKSGQSVICVKSIVHLEDVEFEPNSIGLRQSDGLLVLGGMRHALKRYRIV